MQDLNNKIKETKQALQALETLQQAQRTEFPRLQEKANTMVKSGYSEAYIQSNLYASRSPNVGIKDITNAIEKAKTNLIVS